MTNTDTTTEDRKPGRTITEPKNLYDTGEFIRDELLRRDPPPPDPYDTGAPKSEK